MTEREVQVAVPGGHLATSVDGSGPAVVLLHGGALDSSSWDDLVPLLPGRTVVRVDARGHGASSTPTAPSSGPDDVAAVLDALDLPVADVVGLSMGAGTALETAIVHPARVRSVVAVGAAAGEPQFHDPWILERLARWQRAEQERDAQAWVDVFLEIGAVGPFRTAAQVGGRDVVERCRRMALATIAAHVRPDAVPQTPLPDGRDRLPEITVPVLAVAGTLDCPDHLVLAQHVAAVVPRGRLALVDGTAHVPPMERPRAFADLVGAFLADLDGPACPA